MKKTSKIISIITVVKNDKDNINKTIKSIITQKNNLIEYLVIDGGSNDGTLKEINKYKKTIDLIVSKKDKGIYYAMNKGIKLSKGQLIGFCNSGDIIYPGSLRKIIEKYSREKFDLLFGTVKRNYTKGVLIKSGVNLKRIFYNFDFATSHSTGFYVKKQIHEEIGCYDTNFKISADYDLYLRIVKKNKYKISSTPKKQLIGEMSSGGHSSKFSFFEHLNEESRIRFKNKQNIIFIFVIYVNATIKFLLKKFT